MKTEEFNNKDLKQAPYASPSVKVIEVFVQRVLCGSTPNSPEQYGTDTW